MHAINIDVTDRGTSTDVGSSDATPTVGLSDESSSDDGLDLSEHVAPTEDEERDMLQRVEAHRAAEGRGALHDARQAARREGRPEEWWVARPPTQARCGLANSGATCYLNSLLQALYALEPQSRAAAVWWLAVAAGTLGVLSLEKLSAWALAGGGWALLVLLASTFGYGVWALHELQAK